MATTTGNESLQRSLKQLYRELRNEMFNRDYYGCILHRRRRQDRIIQLLIAFGSSSAVAGWTVLREGPGAGVWALMAALTTVLAIAQPILNLSKDVERYSKLFMSHASIYDELARIVEAVEIQEDFPATLRKAYADARRLRSALAADDDPKPDLRLARRIQSNVNQRWPVTKFWMPPRIAEP